MCRHAPPPTSWQTCKLLTTPQDLCSSSVLTKPQTKKIHSCIIYYIYFNNHSLFLKNYDILTLPLFRPSQKCPETGCVLPAVGAGEWPRQLEVRQERVHLPRHPGHPRPPRHDPGVRGKLIRAKYFYWNYLIWRNYNGCFLSFWNYLIWRNYNGCFHNRISVKSSTRSGVPAIWRTRRWSCSTTWHSSSERRSSPSSPSPTTSTWAAPSCPWLWIYTKENSNQGMDNGGK